MVQIGVGISCRQQSGARRWRPPSLTTTRQVPPDRRRVCLHGHSIADLPAFTLAGHAARVPLIHRGVNPASQDLIAPLPAEEHARLKVLSNAEPAGLLQISADVDPDYREGSELTSMHGVAVAHGATVPDDLDAIDVPAGQWAVFRSSGPYPDALQDTYAATASEWFPSNPSWRMRPGPSIVAVLDRADDFSTATTELWVPIERT